MLEGDVQTGEATVVYQVEVGVVFNQQFETMQVLDDHGVEKSAAAVGVHVVHIGLVL